MQGRHLIAIPCCTTKAGGGDREFDPRDPVRIVNRLPGPAAQRLSGLRRELAEGLSVDPAGLRAGPDLGLEGPVPPVRPAYQRFRGLLYREIPGDAWERVRGNPEVDVVIVSSLYGLLDYREPVRDYDLHMDGEFRGRMVKDYWRRGGLPDVLAALLQGGGYGHIHNYLSTNYNGAAGDLETLIPATAEYRRPKVKAPPMQANRYRGRELLKLLQSLAP